MFSPLSHDTAILSRDWNICAWVTLEIRAAVSCSGVEDRRMFVCVCARYISPIGSCDKVYNDSVDVGSNCFGSTLSARILLASVCTTGTKSADCRLKHDRLPRHLSRRGYVNVCIAATNIRNIRILSIEIIILCVWCCCVLCVCVWCACVCVCAVSTGLCLST